MSGTELFAQGRLARGAGDLWDRGTRAAFLDAVGHGSLPEAVFNRWLVQDYLFVQGFAPFVALTAAKAERPAQSVVIGGLAALDAELQWFEDHLQARGLDPTTPPHPTCRRYIDFLIVTGYSQPKEVLLTPLYGVEAPYTVAWGRLEPTGPYAMFIDRWTNPEFQVYVVELQKLADDHPHEGQQEIFNEVMRHEHAFWRMTWEG